MQQKLVPDLFIILVNNPKQPLHARNSFKSKIFWKRIIKKPLKSPLYFFTLQVTKQVEKKSFISDVLPDQLWQCNIKRILSYSKITSANSCNPIYNIINYSNFICLFESGGCETEGKNLQKFEYKELFRWNKKPFS